MSLRNEIGHIYHIYRPFPAQIGWVAFARTIKPHKTCNSDTYWHTNFVQIPACLFSCNIFSSISNAMSAHPTLLRWHLPLSGTGPASWQGWYVNSFLDNLP